MKIKRESDPGKRGAEPFSAAYKDQFRNFNHPEERFEIEKMLNVILELEGMDVGEQWVCTSHFALNSNFDEEGSLPCVRVGAPSVRDLNLRVDDGHVLNRARESASAVKVLREFQAEW
ncbi:MAG: hypothetical protein K2X27_10040 [Candidatus Obscuribacterales bacterium]|nr:hypothetical protein [Candidatus Obscuribacterales bacterium]